MIILSSACIIEDDPPLQNHSLRREVFHQSEVTAQVLWRVDEQSRGSRTDRRTKETEACEDGLRR